MKKNTTKFILLVLSLLLVFGVPTPVHAQGIVYGDTVPTGKTIDQDILLVGQNVLIDGTVNGNVFIFGNQIQINGDVNGSLILIGQNIGISGGVSGGVYALGLTLELGTGADLGRDLYVLSVGMVSETDTAIKRDLFALGLDAGLNGSVGRDLHTAIGPIQLYNGLMTLLGFEELTLKLHFELPQAAPESDTNTNSSRIFPRIRARIHPFNIETQAVFDWNTWGIGLAREWITLSLFGLLAIWLAPQKLEQTKSPLLKQPWKTTGIGLVAFVISVNLFVVGILIAALFFSIGLALNYLQLWQLSIVLWIISYSLLALGLTALWLFIVYGTKIIFIYVVFTWMLSKLESKIWIKILAILIGALVYVILRSVPTVGWVIGVLVTAAGMGTAWLSYQDARKPAKPVRKPQKKKIA